MLPEIVLVANNAILAFTVARLRRTTSDEPHLIRITDQDGVLSNAILRILYLLLNATMILILSEQILQLWHEG